MIIAKTPLRVPLAGGLTDLKAYADRFGGLTLSSTIDKYIYVAVKKNHSREFELHYLNAYEKVEDPGEIRHDHIREAIKLVGLTRKPLDISIMNDLRHEGGLGSSGALSAALLSALHAFKGESVDAATIIAEASRLEMDILDGASGYHDHTITHLGGFRLIEYSGGIPSTLPLGVEPAAVERFMRRLMLFRTGFHAKTKPSLALLSANQGLARASLDAIKANALDLRDALQRDDLDGAGACLRRQQDLKQKLPGCFENDFVIDIMRRAETLGIPAQIPGGKVGAFLLLYRPLGVKKKMILRHFGDLVHIPFRPEPAGTSCVTT